MSTLSEFHNPTVNHRKSEEEKGNNWIIALVSVFLVFAFFFLVQMENVCDRDWMLCTVAIQSTNWKKGTKRIFEPVSLAEYSSSETHPEQKKLKKEKKKKKKRTMCAFLACGKW